MTRDFLMGQLRLIAIAILAYGSGKGWFSSADAAMLTQVLTPLGVIAAPWIWSVYTNLNGKLVPHDSVAIKQISGEPLREETLNPRDGKIMAITDGPLVKVVGVLLLGLMLMSSAPRAYAADAMAPLRSFAVGDIQAALDDATANNDGDAVQCWTQLISVVKSQQGIGAIKPGVFLALQKARDVVHTLDAIQAGTGPIGDLKRKCAAVILDTQTFLIRLGAIGVGAIK